MSFWNAAHYIPLLWPPTGLPRLMTILNFCCKRVNESFGSCVAVSWYRFKWKVISKKLLPLFIFIYVGSGWSLLCPVIRHIILPCLDWTPWVRGWRTMCISESTEACCLESCLQRIFWCHAKSIVIWELCQDWNSSATNSHSSTMQKYLAHRIKMSRAQFYN